MDVTMLQALGRTWWLVLLRGLSAIVFGILAWTWPGVTLITLVLFWGAYALVDGVAALIAGWQAKDSGKPMWQVVLVGVIGIAAGIFTFVQPGVTAVALLILIAAWAIVHGIFEIAAAIRLRKEIQERMAARHLRRHFGRVRDPHDPEPGRRRDGGAVDHRRVRDRLWRATRHAVVQAQEARGAESRDGKLTSPRVDAPGFSASACTSNDRRIR